MRSVTVNDAEERTSETATGFERPWISCTPARAARPSPSTPPIETGRFNIGNLMLLSQTRPARDGVIDVVCGTAQTPRLS